MMAETPRFSVLNHSLTVRKSLHRKPYVQGEEKEGGVGGPGVKVQAQGGGKVQELRKELDRLHYQAKSKDGVRGGVSMWPAMEDMRLSRGDVWRLAIVCVGLVVCTIAMFNFYHGVHISQLKAFAEQLEVFTKSHSLQDTHSRTHSLQDTSDGALLRVQLLSWHRQFLQLQNAIHRDFDVVWTHSTTSSNFILALYIGGVFTLLYFLLDNMFSKSRLTPARIKVWISLLCVIIVWTVLIVYLLLTAQRVETATRNAVYSLNDHLAVLIQSDLDLTLYHDVMLYWRTRCLPPTSTGVLSVLGLIQVQDITYYLQYYSLPVLTAICTPIIKLLLLLKTVYSR